METLNLQFPESDFQAIPYAEQWLGLWCIEPSALENLVSMAQILDLKSHLASQKDLMPKGTRQDIDGVAVVNLYGPLQKHVSSMGGGTSTVLARRDIRAASLDPNVGAILLNIESPGGTSAGNQELANDIVAAGRKKPVYAYCNDLCASAAYWLASQATNILANEAALVGSIGTYAVVNDSSEAAKMQGVKVHVVKAGDFKGAGTPGTELSEDALSEVQRHVESRNEFFLAAVSKGRKLSREVVSGLADGRMHTAKEAITLGLVDSIATFDEAMDLARSAASEKLSKGKKKMAISSQEIKSACPGCTSDFIVSCLEQDYDLVKCTSQWMQELALLNAASQEKIDELNEQLNQAASEKADLLASIDDLNEKLEAASAKKVGVKPLSESSSTETSGSPYDEYWKQVQELRASGKTRAEAMSHVNKFNPQLREAMVALANNK